jgi:UDP-N-acetylmuramate--alanine ligase
MSIKQAYHFVGIGGIGMSGLAKIALERGHVVSGSDISPSPLLDLLQQKGAAISIGHEKRNMPEGATLVYSTDISADNPEIIQAKEQGSKLVHRSLLLKDLMQGQKPLLVAGTHGKTTTSSLLAHVLDTSGLNPSFALGGIPPRFSTNGRAGSGAYFVAEADESDGSFLNYHAEGAIITNIDLDHMNHFGTEENLVSAFKQFADLVKNRTLLLYCGDDSRLSGLNLHATSYGFSEGCHFRGSNFRQEGLMVFFDLREGEAVYPSIEFPLPGLHSALNAMAVFALGLRLGISEKALREGLKSFSGVKRRSEIKGEIHRILVIDDYGHHPTEIATTIQGIKRAYPLRKLHVLFQPHRYSRTADCLEAFGTAFEHADAVHVLDIYGAGEKPLPNVHARDVVAAIQKHSSVPVKYVAKEGLLDTLHQAIKPFDVLLTMGAGDVTKVGPQFLEDLEKRAINRLKVGLIFGGKSVEHDISLRSAKNVAAGFTPDLFDVHAYYIGKDGRWSLPEQAFDALNGKEPTHWDTAKALSALCREDAVFPVLHGPNGEDGSIQGLFKILGIPFAGCGVMPSAIAMDKAMTKRLAEMKGLKVAPYLSVTSAEWRKDPSIIVQKIQSSLTFPLYVKPVHLGSTLGVHRVSNAEELTKAIQNALSLDLVILVEQEIRGREIEFALFGAEDVVVMPPGEVMSMGSIYGYEEKYFSDAIKTTPKADLTLQQIAEGCAFAKSAYQAIGCDGYARVDCFMQSDGTYILNEINPIPGFTATSLYPQIALQHGMRSDELIQTLLLLGMERARQEKRKGL